MLAAEVFSEFEKTKLGKAVGSVLGFVLMSRKDSEHEVPINATNPRIIYFLNFILDPI
jgi:hypothetical protein